MKRILYITISLCLVTMLFGCSADAKLPQVAATTLPVYEFTTYLCQDTDITVGRVVTESVSCLHDYSLQVRQMRMLEGAELVITNGAGLEDFLMDALPNTVVDASNGIDLICPETEHHDHSPSEPNHHHDSDSHIWLSPINGMTMAENICSGLMESYPEYTAVFQNNLSELLNQLQQLQDYGEAALADLRCRELVTFHDGFSYFAQAFDLSILKAMEEESGSEASAAELKELVQIVRQHQLPAVFTERNGSVSAADIIAAETGAASYALDMAMSGDSYFDAMYHNINTIKEALG